MKAFITTLKNAYNAVVDFTADQYIALVDKHAEVADKITEIESTSKSIAAWIGFITMIAVEVVVAYYVAFFALFAMVLVLSIVFSVWIALLGTVIGWVVFCSDVSGNVMTKGLHKAFTKTETAN